MYTRYATRKQSIGYDGSVRQTLSRSFSSHDSVQIVIEREYSATYAYYKVPSPWLQVKLLRLLQYYPPSGAYYLLQSRRFSDAMFGR